MCNLKPLYHHHQVYDLIFQVYYDDLILNLNLIHFFLPLAGGCAANQFRCQSGTCIPASYACDYYPDCTDHTDEFGCGTFLMQGPFCVN